MEATHVIIPDSICQHMKKLKEKTSCRDVSRHTYLYLEEDASDSVYILEQGMIMLTKLMPNGAEIGIILLTGKNLFGHCEVIGNIKREHQAMALTQCKIRAVSAEDFTRETKKSNEFSLALARLQNERLRHVEKHLGAIFQSNVTKRLTTTLFEIAINNGCDEKSTASIKPCPTHQDLATMIASTRETVSSIMGKLRKQNIITFDRKELKIINADMLHQYSME